MFDKLRARLQGEEWPEPIPTHQEKWAKYLSERRGTYEYRARTRFAGVLEKLKVLGLKDGHSVLDLGAGDCQFGRYLLEQGHRIRYIPLDASINGVNLERWKPLHSEQWDFVVSIEVAEHLIDPIRFLRAVTDAYSKGTVVTTPNCEVVDVLRCDPTHVSIVTLAQLKALNFSVEAHSWFSEQDKPGQLDTLLAWK